MVGKGSMFDADASNRDCHKLSGGSPGANWDDFIFCNKSANHSEPFANKATPDTRQSCINYWIGLSTCVWIEINKRSVGHVCCSSCG